MCTIHHHVVLYHQIWFCAQYLYHVILHHHIMCTMYYICYQISFSVSWSNCTITLWSYCIISYCAMYHSISIIQSLHKCTITFDHVYWKCVPSCYIVPHQVYQYYVPSCYIVPPHNVRCSVCLLDEIQCNTLISTSNGKKFLCRYTEMSIQK